MRALLIGFLAGVTLIGLRAPLGLELVGVPATPAAAAHAFRAAALMTVALGLILAGRRLFERPFAGRLLAGAAAGIAYRGLLFEGDGRGLLVTVAACALLSLALHRRRAPLWLTAAGGIGAGLLVWLVCRTAQPESHARIVVFALTALGAMTAAGRLGFLFPDAAPEQEALGDGAEASAADDAESTSEAAAEAAEAEAEELVPPVRGELTGLALAGCGATLAITGVLRLLRLLGGGQPVDDVVFSLSLAVFATLGAGAFSGLFGERGTRRFGRPLCLVAAAGAGLASRRALGNLSGPRGLDQFLGTFGLDGSQNGTLVYDLAVAGPVLAGTGLFLGAGLKACRQPVQVAALALGAAVGTVLVPRLLAVSIGLDEGGELAALAVGYSGRLVGQGTALAALGAVIALASSGRGLRHLGGATAAAAAMVAGGVAWARPVDAVHAVSPWLQRPPSPELVLELPEGLLTVEPSAEGIDVVTLDRKPLTPPLAGARADRLQLEHAWSMLGELPADAPAPRVLLVGQLTPGRALTLGELGAGKIDRTGAWCAAMPLIERHLFEDEELPPGEVLTTATARSRIGEGQYDLILVPPVPGTSPSTRNLASPEETTVVLWLDARGWVAQRDLGERVLPCTADLLDYAVAVVHGPRAPAGVGSEVFQPRLVNAGAPLAAPDPLDLLAMTAPQRERDARRALARRLAGGSEGSSSALLLGALAVYFDAQRASSQFERRAQQVELPDETIGRIGVAATRGIPDAFTRQVTEGLAAILRGKRWVDRITGHLEAPAAEHFPWPALEEALAYADLELLEPGLCAERLTRLLAATEGTAEQWVLLAEARAQSGQSDESAQAWWRALELAGESRWIRRGLAMQLVRNGDPEGAEMIRDLLLEDPDDEPLHAYLGTGPFPAPSSGVHLPQPAHEGH